MEKFFITTAIDYVNSTPHLGTAYEKIGADIIARFHRLKGNQVYFQMGNDEHSINVKKAAEKEGLSPKEYCDHMRPQFENIWKKLNISYDQFIQTSNPKHHEAVQKFFALINKNGDIYEGDYEGLYCESCEAFYTEKDLTDGFCPNHKTKPATIKEKNYFFKLSKYAKPLLEYISKNQNFILPEMRRNEIINVIKGGLKDVSVSRSGFDWGIKLPTNQKHVVYVWFDALINYITWIGFADDAEKFSKMWPASLHVVGKDITRFHCIIWPAMLLSAGLKIPETVFGHGFVYLKGEKMSKSLGNVVTPLDVVNQYGADALRYYLMRTASFGDDSNFTWDDFINRYNSDLANGLGNLVSRISGMITRYFAGRLPMITLSEKDLSLTKRHAKIFSQVEELLNPKKSGDILFHRALESIWAWISEIDRFIDNAAPWTLAKQNNQKRLNEVLITISQCLFYLCPLLQSFIPETVEKIRSLYGFENDWNHMKAITITKGCALFPRIEVPKA